MPGVVEYIIKMQDGLSSPLLKIAGNSTTARGALDALTKSNKQLAGMMQSSASSSGNLLNGVLGKFSQIQSLLPPVLQEAVSGVVPILTNPFFVAGTGVVTALNMGIKSRNQRLDFTSALGDNVGSELFESLRNLKTKLGDESYNLGKTLLSGDFKADTIAPTLLRIGDLAGGSREKLSGLTETFASINRSGSLTEDTFNSLVNNGFNPIVSLQKKFGQSTDYWKQKLSEGSVSADAVKLALEDATSKGGEFYNVMNKMNSQPSVMWDVLTTKVGIFTEKFGEKLLPVYDAGIAMLTTGLDLLSGGFDIVASGAEKVWNWMGKNADILETLGGIVFGAVVAYKGFQLYQKLSFMWMMRNVIAESILATITGGLTVVTGGLAIAQNFLNAAFIASPIGWVIGGIALLTGGIIYAWKNFETFRKVLYGVWETFKEVFSSIGRLFKQIFSPIGEAIQAIKEGRWMDAGKATGKLLFNLTPVGLAKNAIDFTKSGGFDNVSGAYGRGSDKGAESWKNSQKKASATSATDKLGLNDTATKDKPTADPTKDKSISSGINAVSGGGGVKQITISVGTMVKDLTFHIVGGSKEVAQEMERVVEEAVIRALGSATRRG